MRRTKISFIIPGISLAFLLCLFSTGTLNAQGKYLNTAAQREMDKPIITASSILPPGSSSNYSPDNLMDGTEASWSEGVKGSGVGEYLQVDFRFPDEMKYVMIKNGFGKEKYWKANARIREIKISNEVGESRVIVLEDTPGLQVVGLQTIEENEDMVMEASGGLYGSSFKFEINDVYPGEKWQDACITEINFNQWHTEMFPMTEEYIVKNLFKTYFEGVFDKTGSVFFESDWDGYVELSEKDGYVFEEIVSGDGTSGHNEYQVFINRKEGEYYLLTSNYIKDIDYEHIDFNEEVQQELLWRERFLWEFSKYDVFDEKFIPLEPIDFDRLFEIDLISTLSKSAGENVSLENIWITVEEQGYMKIIFPQTLKDPKAEAYYVWDGSLFRLK